MTAVEALRLQLDNLQKEKQELEVRLVKCTHAQPDAVAIVEIEQERDHWRGNMGYTLLATCRGMYP